MVQVAELRASPSCFLSRKRDAEGECQIRYHDIGDYLDRKQKLDTIRGFGSIRNMEDRFRPIIPNVHHDWINQRSEAFLNCLPLGEKDNKRNKGTVPSVFTLYSRGVATTHRDAWAYNFSKGNLAENMQKTIEFYNSEVTRYQQTCEGKSKDEKPDVSEFINFDSTQLHWDREIKKRSYPRQMWSIP